MRKSYTYSLLIGFLFITVFITGSFPGTVEAANDPLTGNVVKGERPPINISTIPDQAFEQGIIRIKFSKALENFLDNAVISSNPDGTVRFGIAAIDQLNQQYGVIQVKKTFDVILQNTPFNDRHRLWEFHLWYDLIIPAGTDIRSMVMAYSSQSDIQFSEPVYRKEQIGANTSPLRLLSPPDEEVGLNYVPGDPRYNEQWHYHNTGQQGGTADADIDLPEAWDIIKGNSSVIVAVEDGGIDYTHIDLAANMWPGIGYNFVTNSAVVTPDDHGTHVAGTVAANTNNAVGVSGVAGGSGSGNGIRLMSCQVFTSSSSGGFENAPIWAADNGAAISQNSWGYTSMGVYDQVVLDAIDYFNANGGGTVLNGGISIYSAGNSNSTGLKYPACYSGAFSVAATNNQDIRSWYSTWGSWVDIAAPGGETNTVTERGVLSTLPGNTYGFYQGTSMACPHVSGVAALIVSLAPGLLTSQNVKDILTSTTDNISGLNPGYTGMLGSGRMNAYQALLATQAYLTPTANFSASPTTLCIGGSTTFTNLSLGGPTSWNWSFPGGTPSSYVGQNPPAITYAATGTYNVSLTVSDGVTSDTETKTGFITVKNVIADFTGTPTTLLVGNSVVFTDNSGCSPTSWVWSFPGGTPSSFTGQNPPPITYSTPGNYDVTLTASKPGASDVKTKTGYIIVNPISYCTSPYTSGTGDGDFISLVQLGSINNATGASSSPYYTYYSSLSTDLNPGSAYTLTVSPGTYPEGNNFAAWIDFNKNGTFETNEKLGNILISGAAPLTGTIPFTVPADASTGTTRMRVREVYNNNNINPCSSYSFGETEDYNINIVSSSKTLNLTVFLEGLYSGSGTMNQANNGFGPQYVAGVADQVTVELRNSANFSIIEHTASNVNLGTNGAASFTIPAALSGSYYINIKHRNSIATTSASPVSFAAASTGYSFDLPSKAFGSNLRQMPDGYYVIYAGDVNEDGIVNASDLTSVNSAASTFVSGYLPTDVNGDGLIDAGDMILTDNNASKFIVTQHP